jgi:hypothetical protein
MGSPETEQDQPPEGPDERTGDQGQGDDRGRCRPDDQHPAEDGLLGELQRLEDVDGGVDDDPHHAAPA